MAARENITAVKLNACSLKGVLINNLVRTITIRESICSPYLTGEVLALDNSNAINNLEIMGGDPCIISFSDPMFGKEYKVDMYVLDIKGTPVPENISMIVYTISLVSSEYFTDRGESLSVTSQMNQTGVSLIQQIWKTAKFMTTLDTHGATDNPLQDGQTPFHVDYVKPFTAIGQIRDIQVYPQYKTGNVLLYRDAIKENIVPLQCIYENATQTEWFIQKQTWGSKLEHLFGGDNSYRAIMVARENSRATMLDPEAFVKQSKRANDIVAGKFGTNIFLALLLGAGLNMASTNSDRTSPEIDFSNIMDAARCYASCLKAQPQYLIKVPIQSGINITAGVGCRLELLPITETQSHPHTGLYLVTDLIHEVHNDLRVVNGTTSFQALKCEAKCNCGV